MLWYNCPRVVGTQFDFRQLRKYSMLGIGITTGLLLLIHVPQFSHTANGATRWVQFHGISIQPSEIGKLALTIYAAHWLSSKKDDVRHSIKGLIPFGTVLVFTTLLIFQQPDLGTAAVVSAAMLGMFFVSGARVRHLVSLAALFIPVAYFVTHKGGYWQTRIDIWRHPLRQSTSGGRLPDFPRPAGLLEWRSYRGQAWATGNPRIPVSPPRKPILFSPRSARKPG